MAAKRVLLVVAATDALLVGHMRSPQRRAAPSMSVFFSAQHIFSRDVDRQDLEYAARLDGLGEDARRELGMYAAPMPCTCDPIVPNS